MYVLGVGCEDVGSDELLLHPEQLRHLLQAVVLLVQQLTHPTLHAAQLQPGSNLRYSCFLRFLAQFAVFWQIIIRK